MQTFRLIRAFRDFNIGDTFTKDTDGEWRMFVSVDEDEEVSDSVCDTLLDVGGYFEDITPTEFTPTMGHNFYFITGAGEVKRKEWTNSDWCQAQRNFLGIFETEEDALNETAVLTTALRDMRA